MSYVASVLFLWTVLQLPISHTGQGQLCGAHCFFFRAWMKKHLLPCASNRPAPGTFLTPDTDVNCPPFPHPLPLWILICTQRVGIAWSSCLEVEKFVFIALGLLARCCGRCYGLRPGLTGSCVLLCSAQFYFLCEAEGDHSDSSDIYWIPTMCLHCIAFTYITSSSWRSGGRYCYDIDKKNGAQRNQINCPRSLS